MKLYSENEHYKLYQGNMLDMLEVIEPNSIDSIVTDPPYGLTSITKRFGKEDSAECQYGKDGSFARLSKGFMGKEWDGSGIEYNIETWQKCYEVLKPGGYLLAFGGSRTFHRIACAIEDAGFEIRDTIMWLYGAGFPKSMNVGKQLEKRLEDEKTKQKTEHDLRLMWERDLQKTKRVVEYWNKFGTALKPSFEPIIVARKPFKGSLVDNIIENGVGGINIDECRVEPTGEDIGRNNTGAKNSPLNSKDGWNNNSMIGLDTTGRYEGRFPANTILTYDETDFDEVCGGFPNTSGGKRHNTVIRLEDSTSYGGKAGSINTRNEFNDSGSASRYFYCAKASKKDRDEGLDEFEEKLYGQSNGSQNAISKGEEYHKDGIGLNQTKLRKNIHPTVKPTELMQYLVRLVSPNGATILDPFNGSGSTGKAVMYENKERNKNYKYIGIELTEEYLPIAKARIEYASRTPLEILKEQTEEMVEGQTSIFDFIGNEF